MIYLSFYYCDKHIMTKGNGEDFLQILGPGPSLREFRIGSQDRMMKAGTEAEAVEEGCFLHCFSCLPCTVCFVMQPKATCPGLALSMVGGSSTSTINQEYALQFC